MTVTTRIERTAAPLRQQVVRLIREDILDGTLAPGARLVEGSLCDTYGVSRTVIREALRQLETEHLIQMLPSKGPIVTVLKEKEIRAIYVVRAALEGLAGQLFALNASEDDAAAFVDLRDRLEPEYRHGDIDSRERCKAQFYEILLRGAGNEVLTETLTSIHARIALFRRFAFLDEKRVELSIVELTEIINGAAVQRDPEAARKACADHITLAADLAVIEYRQRGVSDMAAGQD